MATSPTSYNKETSDLSASRIQSVCIDLQLCEKKNKVVVGSVDHAKSFGYIGYLLELSIQRLARLDWVSKRPISPRLPLRLTANGQGLKKTNHEKIGLKP